MKSTGCRLGLFGLLLALAGQTLASQPPPTVSVGDTPPDDLGRSRNGDEILISARRGKVLVVTFWASWCGYCRKELPILAGLQDAAGKDRLEVVAVNFQDDRDVYRGLLRRLKDIHLTMTHDATGRIGDAYGVKAIPHLLVIGRDGKVAFKASGYGEESLQEILDAVNGELARPLER